MLARKKFRDRSDDLVRRNGDVDVGTAALNHTRSGAEHAAIGWFNSILLHLSGKNVDRGPPLTTDRDDGQTIREWRAGSGLTRVNNGDDMNRSRTGFCLTAALVALSSAAMAQAQVTPPATRPAPAASTDQSKATLAAEVEHWTKARWEAAKKEWAKDTTKWANCQKQWNRYKHEDRKNWPSIYKCMTN